MEGEFKSNLEAITAAILQDPGFSHTFSLYPNLSFGN